LTPILALLLTHDLLVGKRGVAAPKNHVLKLAITRHKARLSAEFTKTRIKGGHSTVDALRQAINEGAYGEVLTTKSIPHPRWVRVNTLKTSLGEQLHTTFKNYTQVSTLKEVIFAPGYERTYYIDEHIPDLLALPPKADLSKFKAYASGEIIFQEKASCFPAYLLNVQPEDEEVIDACAAPGNKTTHLAALIRPQHTTPVPRIHAFEKSGPRTKILRAMLHKAGIDGSMNMVRVHGKQDFLETNTSYDFPKVSALLLDPSCSGSGIIGRDDTLKIHLPSPQAGPISQPVSKKRKRGAEPAQTSPSPSISLHYSPMEEEAEEETQLSADAAVETRLAALSSFQLSIIQHAMWFPRARKITYSTCSIHFAENEGVVIRALATDVAKKRGWRVLRRDEQVEGMKKWDRRGVWEENGSEEAHDEDRKSEVLDACLRCEAGTEEGTMGFFVVGFVRDANDQDFENVQEEGNEADLQDAASDTKDEGEEDEWNGFSDEGIHDEKAAVETSASKTCEAEAEVQAQLASKKRKNRKRRKQD
jgi:25S rRNA (cytosine2278-C5)-methyltransferase